MTKIITVTVLASLILGTFAAGFSMSNVYAQSSDIEELEKRIELVEDRTIDFEVKLENHIWNFHVWNSAIMKQIESMIFDIANNELSIDDLESEVQKLGELWFDTYDDRVSALEKQNQEMAITIWEYEKIHDEQQKEIEHLEEQIAELTIRVDRIETPVIGK